MTNRRVYERSRKQVYVFGGMVVKRFQGNPVDNEIIILLRDENA